MNEAVCTECRHFKKCVRGRVPAEGADNPDVIMVLPYPEKADDEGRPFQGTRAQMVTRALAPYKGRYRLTYLVKCPTYKSEISRSGFSEPPAEAVKACLNHLYDDLKPYPNATVMTFGSTSYKHLAADPEVKISREYGVKRQVTFHDLTLNVVPNLDPGSAERHVQNAKDLEFYIHKTFKGIDTAPVALEDKYEILDPTRALKFLKSCISQYQAGKIDHVLFDIENSISLSPINGGDVIMVSVTHKLAAKSYSIPLYVTNEIHHWKSIPKDTKNIDAVLDDYVQRYPNNAKLLVEDEKEYKVPNLPFDVIPVEFEVDEIQRAKLRQGIRELLELIPISGHNLKYDILWLVFKSFCDVSKIRIKMDTQNVSVQLQNTGGGIDNSLKGLARKYFNVDDDWEKEIDYYRESFRLTKDRHFGNIPTGLLGKYAALDVYYNQMLEEKFLEVVPPHLIEVAEMVTRATIPMVEPEVKGIHMSASMFNFLQNKYSTFLKTKRLEIEALPKVKKFMAGPLTELHDANTRKKKPFTVEELHEKALNFNNAAKVGEVMFDKKYYQLPVDREHRTESGAPSTDKDTREWLLREVLDDLTMNDMKDKEPELYTRLAEAKTFVQHYHSFKRISKLLKDYIESFPENMKDFMFYTKFNVNGTITGRMSSPFHSMPNGCDIKRLVVSRWASSGGLILAADESQLELRIVAALSNEKSLIDGFKAGIDAHTGTACVIYSIPPDKVTKKQRQVGKTVNFAVLYGKTVYNLAKDLGITEEEAARIMRSFYDKVDNLLKWKKQCETTTLKCGYVDTMFGRRINIPNAFSEREKDIEEAKRFAVNYRVQSAASDIVLNFVVDTFYEAKRQKLLSILLATVHDSLEYDVYPGELFKMVQIFKAKGETEVTTKYPWVTCPLHLDVELGTSWGGAMKANISHIDDNSMVFESEAQSKDIKMFIADAKKAYNVEYEILERTPIDVNSYKEDLFVRDQETWRIKVQMSSK